MSYRVRIAVVLSLAAAVGGTAFWARGHYLPEGETLPGLRVDGALPTGDLHAFVQARADALLDSKVHLESEGDAKDLGEHTLRELGAKIDVDAVVSQARRAGHDGDVLTRAETSERARSGLIDIPLRISIDDAVLASIVAPYKESFDVAPTSARLDLEHRSVIAEKDGHYLDAYGAAPAVLASARGGTSAAPIKVPVLAVPPRVTSAFVKSLDIHAVLAEFETYFSRAGDQKRRGANIDVAASKLDGLVLSPGEVISFNAIVGDRSEENGFQRSWEIFKGEMVEGVGGGTCQVASTLHAAAFFAGLDVLERLPHSRPSAYIPMGLDSTVVYPIVDLKLRNPHPFPIVLHAKTDGNKLTMQLLGAGKPVKVAFAREVLKTTPYGRKVNEDPKLTGTHVLVKQHGIRGYTVKRTRTVSFDDGRRKVETSTDSYPPTTEIYTVPVGFDATKLPPLPEDVGDDDAAPPPAAAPVTPTTTTTTIATNASGDTTTASDVTFVDAPGAHAPTQAQSRPPKSLTLTR
ncbi:VanW family protein [soil metagenome]